MIKNIVICAPNIFEGGPLTVLNEAIVSVRTNFPKSNIILIINNKKIIKHLNITDLISIETPNSKKSWIRRIIYEYLIFKKISKQIDIDLWISLQDVTSIIQAKYQAVYCHCPIPFYRIKLKDIYLEPSSLLRNLLYNFIYKLNIHRNDLIIVQQEWLRAKFKNMTNHKNIIVAKPVGKKNNLKKILHKRSKNKKYVFIYPTLPRFHKNVEVIGDAVNNLVNNKVENFIIKITINGNENRYAKYLFKKYSKYKNIQFIGLQDKKKIKQLYKKADALIFSSKLETWGLPISEAAEYNLPIIASNLDYAFETLGSYKNASFFKYNDHHELSSEIKSFIENKWKPHSFKKIVNIKPYAQNWDSLWTFIKSDFNNKINENKKSN